MQRYGLKKMLLFNTEYVSMLSLGTPKKTWILPLEEEHFYDIAQCSCYVDYIIPLWKIDNKELFYGWCGRLLLLFT